MMTRRQLLARAPALFALPEAFGQANSGTLKIIRIELYVLRVGRRSDLVCAREPGRVDCS